jgi:uncharacterized protein YjlB
MLTGDVAVLPASTGYQCLSAADDFGVVGAYSPAGAYDDCTMVPPSRKDPLYGIAGPLPKLRKRAK